MDIIRVLRLVEYVGPRDLVEDQLSKSVHGTRMVDKGGRRSITIRAVTLGEVSEILGQENPPKHTYTCVYEPVEGGEFVTFAGPFHAIGEAQNVTPYDPNLPAYILKLTNDNDPIPIYIWHDGSEIKQGWYVYPG